MSEATLTSLAGTPKATIKRPTYDLIILKSIQNEITHFECRVPNLKYKWKKGMDDLADHLPVEAIIRWK